MESPNETAGGSGKAAASTKNMKRCSHCGAKNKDTFEYCVRCSESLEDGGGSWVEPSERRSPMVTILAAAVVGIVGLAVLAMVTGSPDEPQAPTTTRTTPPPAPPSERPGEPILVDVDSDALLAAYNEGLRAYNQGDYDLAIEKLTRVVSDIPNNPLAVRYLGLAYYHRGDFEDAMDSLEEAHQLRPDSFELLAEYVSVAKNSGDNERALQALQDYVADHPEELDARLEIARLARASGNDELAMEQTQYLATTDNLDPEFVYEYGVTLKEAGQIEEAKAVLKNSIELDPESAVAHHALGVTELSSGNPRGAVGSLEEAVAREPTNGDFRFSLAQAYEKLDRVEESLDAYAAYLEHARPGDARAEVVRRQLEIARKALQAEREQKRQAGQS